MNIVEYLVFCLAFCRIVGAEEGERQQTVNVESPEVTVIPDSIREIQANDSDSDGPILYKDEEGDDEDDEYTSSTCLSLVFLYIFCSI